jgi:hypothetical protein
VTDSEALSDYPEYRRVLFRHESTLTYLRLNPTLSRMVGEPTESHQTDMPTTSRSREWCAVLLLISFFIALNIILHTLPCDTPMNSLSDAQWDQRITGHLKLYPFFRRIPFTHMVSGLQSLTGLTARHAFFTLQYLLLAAVSILFYRFLRQIKFSFGWSLVGLALLLSAYPVLLGFSEPVHTWDDIWLYVMLILTLSSLIGRKLILATITFTIALYAREQTLTLYPLFMASIWLFGDRQKIVTRLALMAAPAALFAPYFIPGWQVPKPTDYISSVNWGSEGKTANSTFSLLNSFGVLWLTWILGLVGYFWKKREDCSFEERYIAWGSIYAVATTLMVVMSVGYMRETRLFFVPFLWVIPISLWWMRFVVERLQSFPRDLRNLLLVGAILLIPICLPLGQWLFPDLDYRNCAKLCKLWIGGAIGGSIAVMLLALMTSKLFRPRASDFPSDGDRIKQSQLNQTLPGSNSSFLSRYSPLITVVALTVISILLHRQWCGTPMASPESRWQEIFAYHQTFYPFSIRVFTTWIVTGLHQITGLPLRESFFTFQYCLMAIVALLFHRFLLSLSFVRRMANFGMILFLTAFPILFAYSEPVFTWDDGWTYLFLLLTVMAARNHRFVLAAIWFTLGCVAREQMLLYLPVFAYGVFVWGKESSLTRKLATIMLPVVLYFIYFAATYQSPDSQRYQLLQYNFETFPRATNSLYSIFIAFGAIWIAWLFALRRKTAQNLDAADLSVRRFLVFCSVSSVIPTVIVGLTLTYARETRIFFPPFLFIIPLALIWIESRWRDLTLQYRKWLIGATLLAMVMAVLLAKFWNPDLDYRNCPEFCLNWLGIHVGLTVGVLLLWVLSKKPAISAGQ